MEIPQGLMFSADAEPLRDVVATHRDTCTAVGHTHLHKSRQDKNKCENGKWKMQKTVTLARKYQKLAVGYGFDLL